MTWPAERGFAYDDEQCPRRPSGLYHTTNGRPVCADCGITTYSAKTRGAKFDPKTPSKECCQFSTCDTKVTIRAWVRAWLTLTTGVSVLEDESLETWLCFEHERQVQDARKRPAITIRRSVEGWLWIDNLDHLRFAA